MTEISEFTDEPADVYSEAWRHECECRYILDNITTREGRNMRIFGVPKYVASEYPPPDIDKKCIASFRGIASALHLRDGVVKLVVIRRTKAASKMS